MATHAATPVRYRLTFRGVVAGEWTKFWSLRSSWITLGVSLLLLVAIGVIAALTYTPGAAEAPGPPGTDASNAVGLALAGSTFASLAVGVLGVLIAAGEYSTGLIRATIAAIPTRLPLIGAKTLIFGVVAFLVTAVGAVLAFVLGSPLISGEAIALGIGGDGVLRSLIGAGLYLGLVGVFGVALGMLLRSSAGGIAVLVGLLLIIPGLTGLLPDSWADNISPYLPSNAGGAVMALHESSGSLGPWTGLAVFAGWVALALAGAAYRLVKTDV
ncbi:ABC transporter permease [Winogradskya humida]|uniref:ABC transporter permease n=1 Tax=Winogradskya humida TaxID=113566 RepID=A0ABQ3ZL82_9ACTN|nr:ABC transporter permease [Actinoplanes humidus]GIE19350.1 ABC transporter permease [Actinoplanes humidus]